MRSCGGGCFIGGITIVVAIISVVVTGATEDFGVLFLTRGTGTGA